MNRFLPLLLFLSAPMLSFAQSYEKNGLPCIAELCVGDGLEELSKIKWERAKSAFSLMGKPDYVGSRPIGASDITTVKQIYRGDVSRAVPYLSYEAFDAKAIPLLASITAACGRKELQGTFTTESGNPTTVKIALLTDKNDAAIQRWAIISISRSFPAAISAVQQADIRKQLDERYGRFSVSRGRQTGVDATYAIHEADPVLGGKFGFSLFSNQRPNDYGRYLQNPACGGKQKVSID
jgi:hypothetical protein